MKNHELIAFGVGDLVVYASEININTLKVIGCYQSDDHYWLEGGQLVYVGQIRLATTSEIAANKRKDLK